jgi:hypothetical protein
MDIYEQLIENPLFFKWIFHPTEELNDYWGTYLEQNPEETDAVLEFKSKFEKNLKFANTTFSEERKKRLARQIAKQLDKLDEKKKRRIFLHNIMKYAAVALLFFTIGSSLVYLYMANRQPEIIVENSVLPAHAQEPVLIIDNKQQIQLNSGESELDYSNSGEIIVNQAESVKKKAKGQTPEMNTLIIPYGSRSVITLADGSKVWLNAGSRLIYPSEFVDKRREVFLVGEAFFDIAKDESHPFYVKTTDVEIKVLGTQFNVSAYPEDYSVQTALAEGRVELSRVNAGLLEKKIQLSPGELAYFNKKSRETIIYKVDLEYYTLWTDGLFSFSNTDLNRIIRKLERFYNIRFQFDDPLKGSIQITGKLDVTKEKDEVFEYLSNLTGLDFIKLNENNYAIK